MNNHFDETGRPANKPFLTEEEIALLRSVIRQEQDADAVGAIEISAFPADRTTGGTCELKEFYYGPKGRDDSASAKRVQGCRVALKRSLANALMFPKRISLLTRFLVKTTGAGVPRELPTGIYQNDGISLCVLHASSGIHTNGGIFIISYHNDLSRESERELMIKIAMLLSAMAPKDVLLSHSVQTILRATYAKDAGNQDGAETEENSDAEKVYTVKEFFAMPRLAKLLSSNTRDKIAATNRVFYF